MNEINQLISSQKKKNRKVVFGLVSFLVALSFVYINIGSVDLTIFNFGNLDEAQSFILFDIRIPQLLTAITVGASLAISGMLLQVLFKTPLAGPSVLGVSSMVSLGLAFYYMSGFVLNPFTMFFAALTAGVASIVLLLLASKSQGGQIRILILGIMISFFCGGIIDVLTMFSQQNELKEFAMWGLGSFGRMDYLKISILTLIIAGSFVYLSFRKSHFYNYLLGGYQVSGGKQGKEFFYMSLLITAIITAFVTTYCGPIAFIGVAIPNIYRFIFRVNNLKYLLTGIVLTGAIVALACDLLAKLPSNEYDLPINAVTSLLGIPVIILVLLRKTR